jgi:hypothetical protein
MKKILISFVILITASMVIHADAELNSLKMDRIGGVSKNLFRDISSETIGTYFYDVHSQLQSYVYTNSQKAFDAGYTARDSISNAKELEARVKDIKAKFIESIGGLPSSNSPLNAKIVGTITESGLVIEKIIYNSRPKAYVTANLYRLSNLKGKTGAVLFVCGHGFEAKAYDEYQTVCRYLAKAGLIAMAIDPTGQGERLGYYEKFLDDTTIQWGTTEHTHEGYQLAMLGDSLAKYMVHDGMRGVDYLQSRPDVNKDKIGATGNSGGSTQSSLMMLCDDRIAAAS